MVSDVVQSCTSQTLQKAFGGDVAYTIVYGSLVVVAGMDFVMGQLGCRDTPPLLQATGHQKFQKHLSLKAVRRANYLGNRLTTLWVNLGCTLVMGKTLLLWEFTTEVVHQDSKLCEHMHNCG